MNYGPFYGMPYYNYTGPIKTGLFSRLFGNLNISSILNSTQKTLNFVNQVIPVIKQVQPIMNNAKTMFKVMNEFKKEEEKTTNSINENINVIDEKEEQVHSINTNENLPTFFL